MRRPPVPCKDCPNRRLKCHGDCEEYAEFIRLLTAWKNAVRDGMKADGLEVWEEGE